MLVRKFYLLCLPLLLISLIATSSYSQPVSNFSANQTSGCSPFSLVVSFQDLSTGTPTSWLWSFGDAGNSTSTIQNPTFTYTDPGCYTVSLTTTNASGSNTLTQTCFIEIFPQPTPGFVVDFPEGCAPLTVTITDTSLANSGVITDWAWVLSDGSSSNVQNPTFTLPNTGTLNLIITVTNTPGCQTTAVFPGAITVLDPPVVDFSVDVNSSCNPPLSVNFTNNTQLNGANNPMYLWQFPGGLTPGGSNTSNLATPPSITYSADGQYDVTLIVTSANACSDTLTQPNMIGIGGVVADFTESATVICLGESITFENSSTGGVSSIAWNFGENAGVDGTSNSETYTYTTPGTYSVTLQANNSQCGDTLVKTSLITVNPIPIADFSVNKTEDCQPGIPFVFTDLSAGATSWSWDFGDTQTSNLQNPTHSYSSYGTFSVCLLVTNSDGCQDSICSDVSIVPPNVSFSRTPATGCAPLQVQFTDNSSSPLDPITSWNWDFGTATAVPSTSTQQNPSVNFPTPGGYNIQLIVSTATGCTDTLTISPGVQVGLPPMVDFSVDDDTVCINQEVTFTSTFTNSNWDYFWDFQYMAPGNFTAFDSMPTTTYPDTGTYSVGLIIDFNGCRDTLITDSLVFVSPPRAQFIPNDSVFCSIPATVSLTDASIGPADVFEWYLDSVLFSTQQNPPDFTLNTIGSYVVTQIIQNSLSGCFDTASITINIGNPNASFVASDVSGCKPHAVVFNNFSTNSTQYLWYPNLIGSTNFFNPFTLSHTYQDTGLYTVRLIARDQFGCRDTMDRVDYISVHGPYANFGGDPLSGCAPMPVQFSDSTTTRITNITSWSWDFGDGIGTSNLQNPNYVYPNPGSFDVKLVVVDDSMCVDSLIIPNYVVPTFPLPSFMVDDDSTCAGNVLNFTSTSNGVGLSYFWDFGDGVGTDTVMNPSYAYTDTGSYDVTLILTDVNGCVDSLTIPDFIYIEPFIVGFFGDPTTKACPPLTSQFTDTTIGNVASWFWDFGDGLAPSNLQNPGHVYLVPGQYDVTLTATHEDGCVDSLTKSNYINLAGPNGTFSFDPPFGCLGDSICLTVISTGAVTGQPDWRDGFSPIISGLSGTIDTFTVCHLYTTAGNYFPLVTLTDIAGCSFTLPMADSLSVYGNPQAGIAPLDTTGCVPFPVQFIDTSIPSDSAITDWLWVFGDGDSSTMANPLHIYQSDSVYDVQLFVVDQNGCSDSTFTTLTAYEGAIADFTASDTIGCSPLDITFSDNSSNVPPTGWTWIFGDGDTTFGVSSPTHTYLNDGLYTVTLIIQDGLGCADTLVKPNYINLRHPVAQVYSSTTRACNPITVTFYGDSTQSDTAILQYEWCLTNTLTGQTTCSNTARGVDSLSIDFNDAGNFEMVLTVTDALGCISETQPLVVIIDNRMTPDPLEMRNVSVEDENSAEISWAAYPGADFMEYAIYRTNGPNPGIVGTVTDQNITTFIESSPDLNFSQNSYCYKVLVQNNCLEYSILDDTDEHCTIDLETAAGTDAIILSWSPYVGYTVGQYEIYRTNTYDLSMPPMQIGVVPGNIQSYTDLETFCRDSISYRILAVGFGANDQRSYSDLSADAPFHPNPVLSSDIVTATVVDDSVIDVSWTEYLGYLPSMYQLEKSEDGNNWAIIDTFPLSVQTYTDTAVLVDTASYFYRVFAIDECEDYSVEGYIGKSILMNVKLDRTGKIPQIEWTHYQEWRNGVLSYQVEVLNDATGQFEVVSIVPGNERTFMDNLTNLNQATYCYRIRATEAGGNGAEAISNIKCVIFRPTVYVPNAFTPNNDGHNDEFVVFVPNLRMGEMTIFNRWGELLYQSSDLTQGWDGTRNGQPVQEGVYVFRISGSGVDGTPIKRSGTVTLFR